MSPSKIFDLLLDILNNNIYTIYIQWSFYILILFFLNVITEFIVVLLIVTIIILDEMDDDYVCSHETWFVLLDFDLWTETINTLLHTGNMRNLMCSRMFICGSN